MKTRYKIGVGFILLIIISAGLLSIWWQDQKQKMYDRSLRSSYDYDVMLTTEHHFNNDDPSWEYALVDTEHGLMLSLKNKKPRSIDLSTIVFSNQTIDTMNPLGNEMVLMPKYKLTHNVNASRTYSRTSEQFDYESRMYAYYETSSNANVSISIYLNARNEWWIGGWQSNSYWEVMEVKLFGSQNGWTTVNGELVTGEGTYEI